MRTVNFLSILFLSSMLWSFTLPGKPSTAEKGFFKKAAFTGIKWKTTVMDLGNIPYNKAVTIAFEFTNTGLQPAIITDARASCGCTVANYPKEPVEPGKTATVTATYNAATKGVFNKTVTVYIQDEEPKQLSFKGIVVD